MAEANDQNAGTNPDPQGTPEGASGDNPKPATQQGQGSGKTLTEAEVNAMMADRLSKHEKALRKQFEQEKVQIAERAKMDEADRIKAEKEDLEKKVAELETAKTEATQRAQLAGKVADVDYALFKARQNSEKYVDSDGNVKVDALLKDVESLNPQPTPRTGPAPTTAGGGNARSVDMNNFIRRKAGRS